MLTLLRGTSSRHKPPGPISGGTTGLKPDAVSDLALTLVGGEYVLEYTQPANSVFEREQHRAIGAAQWSSPRRIEDSFFSEDEESTTFEMQVWGVGAGGREAEKSNSANFATFTAEIIPRDTKFATLLGTGAPVPALDFDAMTTADGTPSPLNRAIGSLVIVGVDLVSGSTAVATAPALPAGWEEIVFKTPVGEPNFSARVVMKVLTGTDTLPVNLITYPATLNCRVNYWAKSYDITGLPQVVQIPNYNSPWVEFTTGTPVANVIPSGQVTDSVLAVAILGTTNVNPPESTFSTTPTSTDSYIQLVTTRCLLLIKTRIFGANETHSDITSTPSGDYGRNMHIAFAIALRGSP